MKKTVLFYMLSLILFGCSQMHRETNNSIRIGVKSDVPLIAYFNYSGKRAGSEIEMAKGLAKSLGVKAEFITVTSENRQALLQKGSVDVLLATYSITKERQGLFDFSMPYKIDHQGVMVRNTNSISSIAELSGKKIGVVQGSDSVELLAENFPQIKLVKFDTYYRAMLALSLGDIDGISSDKSVLNGLLALWESHKKRLVTIDGASTFFVDLEDSRGSGDLYKILHENLSDESYGIAVSKQNHKLLEKINEYLTTCCSLK